MYSGVCGRDGIFVIDDDECRGEKGRSFYLSVEQVTMSQIVAVVLVLSFAMSKCTSLICLYCRAVPDGIGLDCVDCGGCLLYHMRQPITTRRSLLVFLHRLLEVNSSYLECVLIS